MLAEIFRSFLNPVVRIKKGEWTKTLLMSLYFFLTITSYYILKPVRDSVFLEKYGAENLPYAWLITIVVLSFVVSIYVKFVDILPKNVLLSSTVIFFVSNLVGFWWLSHFQYRWITAVFFVWVSIFSVMIVTQFWLCANDLFNPREAKRLFGFVGSGGILGGITGGMITHRLALVVGTPNLLLVAAFILLFCALLINIIWEFERDKTLRESEEEMESPLKNAEETRKFMRLIWGKRYILLLVGLVVVTKAVSTLVDYQFKNIVQLHVIGLDARTAFFGSFFAWLNTLSFVVQFFLTSFILRRFGVGTALLLLPVGLCFGSLAILITPALWSAVFSMIYDGSMNYSLNQSTKEVLYLPIFREVRYRVKPFIDTVGYRLAKGIGSVIILFFINFLHFNIRSLSIVSLALIGLWFFMVGVMRKEYVNAIREFLKKDFPTEHDEEAAESEGILLSAFLTAGSGNTEKDMLLALRLYNLASDSSFLNYLSDELQNPIPDVKKKLENLLETSKPSGLQEGILTFLESKSLEESGRAVKFFCEFRPESIESLRGYLESEDLRLQIASACALILFIHDAEIEDLARKILETKREFPDRDLAHIADQVVTRHLEDPTVRDTVIQILKWLSEDLSGQEELLKEIRESVHKNPRMFPVLAALVEAKEIPSTYRRRLPMLLSVCGNQDAIFLLYRMLTEKDSLTRDEAIHALVEVRVRFPEHFFEESAIRQEIEKEITNVFLVQRLTELYKDCSRNLGSYAIKGEDPFISAQGKRAHEGVNRIFLLLTLLTEPQDIRTIYYSLHYPNEHVKANALELLDNIIEEPKLKHAIFEIIESEFAYQGSLGFSRMLRPMNSHDRTRMLSLEDLFQRDDPWTFLSLVDMVLSFRLEPFYAQLCLLTSSPNLFVREIASIISPKLSKRIDTPDKHL